MMRMKNKYKVKVSSMINVFTKPRKEQDHVMLYENMKSTFKRRRLWIQQQPSMQEIFAKYPALRIRKVVRSIIDM